MAKEMAKQQKSAGAAERLLAAGWKRLPLEQRVDPLACWLPPGAVTEDRHFFVTVGSRKAEAARQVSDEVARQKGMMVELKQLHVQARYPIALTTTAAFLELMAQEAQGTR